ncbi:MAG: hypothetical protein KAI24_15000 [Planctomycetes bacterium]|nr:hypothetical protein [Planctomycetota bacterium]
MPERSPNAADDHTRRRLLDQLRAEVRQVTGRSYGLDLAALDTRDIQELLHMVRDLISAGEHAAEQARLTPWRRHP